MDEDLQSLGDSKLIESFICRCREVLQGQWPNFDDGIPFDQEHPNFDEFDVANLRGFEDEFSRRLTGNPEETGTPIHFAMTILSQGKGKDFSLYNRATSHAERANFRDSCVADYVTDCYRRLDDAVRKAGKGCDARREAIKLMQKLAEEAGESAPRADGSPQRSQPFPNLTGYPFPPA